MHKVPIWLAVLILLIPSVALGTNSAEIKLFYKDRQGFRVGFYTGSYALLIGVTRYAEGWPSLERIPRDLDRLQSALELHGFQVEKVLNPTGEQLKKAFELFMGLYGREKQNRLVFYFSGHGFTAAHGAGYLVPSDAPGPDVPREELVRKCLPLMLVIKWAQGLKSKHVLLLFDTCLEPVGNAPSGFSKRPPEISSRTSNPVRHFFATCSGRDRTPAQGLMASFVVKGLGGKADLNGDGYVTGSELANYLYEKIRKYGSGQTPWYAKAGVSGQEAGELVFLVPSPVGSEESQLASQTSDPEADMWKLVRDSSDTRDIKDFLATFPDGRFAMRARHKIRELEGKEFFEKGKSFYRSGDYSKALNLFREAVSRGHAGAQYYMGLMYGAGKGVRADQRAAMAWFREAAAKGYAPAEYRMGLFYYHGEGVQKDLGEALNWFKKAAQRGHTDAAAYMARIENEQERRSLFRKGLEFYKKGDLKEALAWFEKSSEKGHPDAARYMSMIREEEEKRKKEAEECASFFSEGMKYYESKDYAEALKWFRMAEEKGHPDARQYMALIRKAEQDKERKLHEGNLAFEKGKRYFESENYREALRWFEKAVDKGHPDAGRYLAKTREHLEMESLFEKGIRYYDAKNYPRALEWLEKAARKGHKGAKKCVALVREEMEAVRSKPAQRESAESQFNKALASYEQGKYKEAFEWFKKAANQGHAGAQNYLGLMYDAGRGTKRDEREAVKWFRKAAEQGHKYAQYNLGLQYYEGRQVERDYGEAMKWFHEAANQGHAGAQNYLGLMYDAGRGTKRDEREAVKWFRKAAEQGHKYAQYNLAVQYYEGRQVKRDYREAMKWFRKAADHGHVGAQNFIGLMYDSGKGVERDEREAVKWFRKAAKQGHKYAQYNLGLQYYEGRQVERDYGEAVKWFRKAAKQGHPKARYYLGTVYERGLVGPGPDREEALKWYQKAFESGSSEAAKALKRLGQ